MEDKHRKLIEKCCDKMVDGLDIRKIWPELLDDIFQESDDNTSCWEANLDNQEIVKEILMKITKRGPHAFSKFVNILKKTGYKDLANLLEEKTTIPTATSFGSLRDSRNNKNVVTNDGNSHQHQAESSGTAANRDNNENLQANLQQDIPLVIQVKKSNVFLDLLPSHVVAYPMQSNPRGLVLIITLFDKLNGALKSAAINDEINWTNLFQQMGFLVISKPNLTANKIHQTFGEFIKRKELYRADSCFIIILGPGGSSPKLKSPVFVGVDGNTVKEAEIISYFSSERCPYLRKKPKVFMFHACKDELEQMVQPIQKYSIYQDTSSKVTTLQTKDVTVSDRNWQNMLIVRSTMSGHLSYRPTGSWFVDKFCKVFMKHACNTNIEDLFVMIGNRKQVSCSTREKIKHQTLIVQRIGFKEMYVDGLDIRKIWPELLDDIFQESDDNISRWEANLDNQEIVKEILMEIIKRGPHAFSKFVNILKKTGYNGLANLLEEKTTILTAMWDNKNNIANNNRNNNSNNLGSSSGDDIVNLDFTPAQLENINDFDLERAPEPLKIVVEKTTKFKGHVPSHVPVYRMRSNPRGHVLIITLINYDYEEVRKGTEHEEKNLKDLFEQMGFKTICKSNLKGWQIIEEIRKFSQNPELNYVDSCFVIISGHGSRCKYVEESYICGIDSHVSNRDGDVYWSKIISYFSHDTCEALRDKPKVFIFQSCRGQEKQRIIEDINNDENRQSINDSNCFHDESELIFDSDNYRDILIASATIPNCVSYRDPVTGSWFITLICSVFMKYANTCHIRKLFNLVDLCIANYSTPDGYCQTTTIRSINFNRQLYLNP